MLLKCSWVTDFITLTISLLPVKGMHYFFHRIISWVKSSLFVLSFLNFFINQSQLNFWNHDIVCTLYQSPHQKHHLLFFANPPLPLKSANCPNPLPLWGNYPLHIVFFREPPLKSDYLLKPHSTKIFIFTIIPYFKSN